MAVSNTNSSTRHILSLDNVASNIDLRSVEGGNVFAEVFTERNSDNLPSGKHIGPAQIENFIFEIPVFEKNDLRNVIADTWNGKPVFLNGSLLSVDRNDRVKFEENFFDASLVETIIPACDATSRDVVGIKLNIQPTSIESNKGSDEIVKSGSKAQPLTASAFRFEIDGMDCRFVQKIESFTIKSKRQNNGSAGNRGESAGSIVEFPNLFLTIPESRAENWIKWHTDFVIKGNNGQSEERNGSLIFLKRDLRDELLRIAIRNIGIFMLSRNRENEGQASTLSIGLYCERMEMSV